MADSQKRPAEDNPLFDEQPRGIADNEDFEELDDLDDDLEDEDIDNPLGREDQPPSEAPPPEGERGFTGEVGSEGGSAGDIEVERRRTLRGSEATATAETDDAATLRDRRKGRGY